MRKIIFFDGYCVLCNRFVRELIQLDKSEQFYFSSLSSDFAQKIFQEKPELREVDSIILKIENDSENHYYVRGAAVRKIIQALSTDPRISGLQKLLTKGCASLLKLSPDLFLEKSYELVALSRYKLFGKHEECPIPPLSIAKRFLN